LSHYLNALFISIVALSHSQTMMSYLIISILSSLIEFITSQPVHYDLV